MACRNFVRGLHLLRHRNAHRFGRRKISPSTPCGGLVFPKMSCQASLRKHVGCTAPVVQLSLKFGRDLPVLGNPFVSHVKLCCATLRQLFHDHLNAFATQRPCLLPWRIACSICGPESDIGPLSIDLKSPIIVALMLRAASLFGNLSSIFIPTRVCRRCNVRHQRRQLAMPKSPSSALTWRYLPSMELIRRFGSKVFINLACPLAISSACVLSDDACPPGVSKFATC